MICSSLHRLLAYLILAFSGVGLGGCVDESSQQAPDLSAEPSLFTNYVQLAPIAPPKSPDEIVPYPDNVRSQIWRPGYWHYNYTGATYDWVPGQLIARPSPTAVWSPDHWIEHTYGWAFAPGYWQ